MTRAVKETAAEIERMLRLWEEGKQPSPDERDYVLAGVEATGANVTYGDIEHIADELFVDAGEKYTSVEDIAQFVVDELDKLP